jgi:LemA protein
MIFETFFGIIFIVVIISLFIYNRLVHLKNSVKNSWAGIDVQLKRRESLIPNLVNTVKGYAKFEKGLLKEITMLRVAMMNSERDIKRVAAADNVLSESLKSLFAVSENYPRLKSNKNFLELQKELINTEDEIASARRIYNANVRDYNTKIASIPDVVFAKVFGFEKEEFFTATNYEKKEVKLSFS